MIINSNKYSRWYFSIIERAKQCNRKKSKTEYFESHHIIPTSLGGANEKDNLVLLTAREHYICHWLLPYFTVSLQKAKMVYAFQLMNYKRNSKVREIYFNSKGYEVCKKLYLIKEISKSTRLKMRNAKLGKSGNRPQGFMVSEDTKKKMSEAKKGKPRTEETKKKISDYQKTKIVSKETREKLRISKLGNKNNLGNKRSEESKLKTSLSNKGKYGYPGKENWNYGKIFINNSVMCTKIDKDCEIPEGWKKGILRRKILK